MATTECTAENSGKEGLNFQYHTVVAVDSSHFSIFFFLHAAPKRGKDREKKLLRQETIENSRTCLLKSKTHLSK